MLFSIGKITCGLLMAPTPGQPINLINQLGYRLTKIFVSTISTMLSESTLAYVNRCTSSAYLRMIFQDNYSNNYSQKFITHSFFDKKQPNNLYRGSRSISKYLKKEKSISDALTIISEHVSNKDMVINVLNGLGPDFDMLVTVIESFDSLP